MKNTTKTTSDTRTKADPRIRQIVCGSCGKSVNAGSGVVVAWGGGGRYHESCLPVGTKYGANGNEFVRKAGK